MRIALVLGFVCCIIVVSYRAQTESRQVMTVCQVLSNLSVLGSQKGMIEVRGQWDGLLWGDCPKLQTGNYLWPNALWVGLPSSLMLTRDPQFPIDWKTNFDQSVYESALKGAWAEWGRLPAKQKEKSSVVATIVGRLDVSPDGLLIRSGLPNGYGIQGVFPAQFVVVELKDIAVVAVSKRIAAPQGGRYWE